MKFTKTLYLCTRKIEILGYGVMVTLQILVLSFQVRILVVQQIKYILKLKPAKSLLVGFYFLYLTSRFGLESYKIELLVYNKKS